MMTDGTYLDTIVQTSKLLFTRLIHQCIAVIFIYSIWIAVENYSNPFSWHVILSTLGLLPFMIEALILFSNDNLWSREISRKQKYWIHGILMSVGSALIIIGIVVEYVRRDGYDHFVSAHSKNWTCCNDSCNYCFNLWSNGILCISYFKVDTPSMD
ncbi:hypothetical protein ILUMI_13242 [Ignelater luminosus]|uniref:Cytochrome b561 domain-containing protein n=1 Tax=Ignelater luminosus TaxID=2038154 RepID=A0A8K0CSM2_IGNLU|nr:hypothetical protein ILUMI_13242 [Ignelater luminosus]